MITLLLHFINDPKLFGIEFFNGLDFLMLAFRFSINLIFTLIIVRYIYYANNRRKEYLFTYILISISVFFLSHLLQNVDLQLGFALGLFALFGIIRYRTNPIPIKEMTYLFLVICISVMNALSDKQISYVELLFANIMLMLVTVVIEYFWTSRHESSKTIIYEKIDLIKPQNQKRFIEDLQKRTGLKINRVEIGKINFLRDTAEITIYYFWDKYSTNFFESESLDNFSFKEEDDD
jgi:multidrug transporter EmrE-like cation transporter